jgi:DNA invertase Pin-like site-specific DNA recombinase
MMEGGELGSSVRDTAVLYLRVSTEDQDLAGQERDLRAECERQGWEVVAVYAEKVSGTGKVERKDYERLLADARWEARPWTQLVVWSLDRFSREERFTKAIDTILDLEKAGISFHSLKEPYLDTPTGPRGAFDVRGLLLSVTSLVASFESRRRSERVKLAMRELKEGRRRTRSGNPPGRPIRVTPEKLAAILRWKAQGFSWRSVAQKVGLPKGTCANAASRARRGALQNLGVPKGSKRLTGTPGLT